MIWSGQIRYCTITDPVVMVYSQEMPSSHHPPRSGTKISLVGRDGSTTGTTTTGGLKLMEFRPQEMKPRKQLKSKIFLRSSGLIYFWWRNLVWTMFNLPGAVVTIDVIMKWLVSGANTVQGKLFEIHRKMTIAGNSKLIIVLLNFLEIALNNEEIWLK